MQMDKMFLFLVTNEGNLIFLFLQGENSIRRYASLLLVLTKEFERLQ